MPRHYTGTPQEVRTLDTFSKLTRCTSALVAEFSVLSPDEQEALGDLCRKLGRKKETAA